MKQSYFMRKMLDLTRRKVPTSPTLSSETYLFLNSNPWFSAVTEYSLQYCLFLKGMDKKIYYVAESGNTHMDEKSKKYGLHFLNLPIHRMRFFLFLYSFICLFQLIRKKENNITHVVVIEGRDHFLMVLMKILFPSLWFDKKLFRLKGQSQSIKNNFFSKIVYKFYTEKTIFPCQLLENKVPFHIPQSKKLLQYFCKDFEVSQTKLDNFSLANNFPILDFSKPIFVVLGRYDFVKGHQSVIDAFLKSNCSSYIQLIFIGKSENLKAADIFYNNISSFEENFKTTNKYCLRSKNKCLFVLDYYFEKLPEFLGNVHFGIISSLDSEMICRVGVEFMQSGIPTIYSDAGALPEVFIDFPEFKYPKNNTQDLSKKIEFCVNLFSDKEKYFSYKEMFRIIGMEKYSAKNYKNIC